jgi:hypothetical protein
MQRRDASLFTKNEVCNACLNCISKIFAKAPPLVFCKAGHFGTPKDPMEGHCIPVQWNFAKKNKAENICPDFDDSREPEERARAKRARSVRHPAVQREGPGRGIDPRSDAEIPFQETPKSFTLKGIR